MVVDQRGLNDSFIQRWAARSFWRLLTVPSILRCPASFFFFLLASFLPSFLHLLPSFLVLLSFPQKSLVFSVVVLHTYHKQQQQNKMDAAYESQLTGYFTGKTVCVTGGSGSIGSRVVEILLRYNVEVVRVLTNSEMELYSFAHTHRDRRIRPLLGDVRDRDRLRLAFRGCDVVIHAAAVKHVDIIEYNPQEAVKTNIIGTMNAVDAAMECGVARFVLISTDKAVKPSSTMGASKMMCERLVVDMNDYTAATMSTWAVRFGNVLGSAGSVLETFVTQVRSNRPVTITNAEMTRFFMHIEDAAVLILESFLHAEGGEIFVLKMPACKIGQLVTAFLHVMGLPADYPRSIIGFRPGEKEWEELLTEDELSRTYDFGHLYMIADRRWQERHAGRTPASFQSAYRSDLIRQMSFEECCGMVRRTLEMMGVLAAQ